MANKKLTLMLLLMFGIGFAPLQSFSAGNLGHMESMPSDCANCDMDGGVDPDACDGTQCMMSFDPCGANHILGVSHGISFSSRLPIAITGYFCNYAHRTDLTSTFRYAAPQLPELKVTIRPTTALCVSS